MKLKIVYDNEAKQGFEKGWGFSCLIELEDEKMLFDTGWDGNVLLSNLKKLGVRPEEIKRAVISHAHWDHLGGLTHIRRRDLQVYVPQSFSRRLREELASRFELHEVTDAQRIREGVWSTGSSGRGSKSNPSSWERVGGWWLSSGAPIPGYKIFSRWLQSLERYQVLWVECTDSKIMHCWRGWINSACSLHRQ